jgi:hypothetical protein
MTFIAVDGSTTVTAPDERLRQLGGTARLAIDLIDYPANLERAFLFALGYVGLFRA